MPSIIAESTVPIGTTLSPAEVKLTGVSQKEIHVVGRATIATVLGRSLIQHTFLVVNESAMSFPQGTKIILGADFIAQNHLTIDTGHWCICRDGLHVIDMLPSVINDKLYQPPKITEAKAKEMIAQTLTRPTREGRDPQQNQQSDSGNRAISARQCTPQGITRPSNKNGTVQIPLADGQERQPQTHNTADNTNTHTNDTDRCAHKKAHEHTSEKHTTDTDVYLVLPRASYKLKTGTTLVKIYLQCRRTGEIIRQDHKNDYMVK